MKVYMPVARTQLENIKNIYQLVDSKHTDDCVNMVNTNTFFFENRDGEVFISNGGVFFTDALAKDEDFKIVHSFSFLKKIDKKEEKK